MKQPCRAFCALVFALVAGCMPAQASGQSTKPAVQPATAVLADVHVSKPSFAFTYFRAIAPLNGRYDLRQGTMVDLISTAYGIERKNVFGGPPWLDYDRYDVTLQVPANATRDAANLELRKVLAERFHLVSHPDTKPLLALVLTAGKGEPKMKPAADTTDESGCQYQRPPGPPPSGPQEMPASFKFQCRNVTMEKYAQILRNYSDPDLVPTVVDQTGLKGAYDFDIAYTLRRDRRGLDIADAVDKQLGLKLAPGTAPQPVVVVDTALETPTPNPAGWEKALPPLPPPAFEVATIKPTPPGQPRDYNIRFNGPTQVTITSATLQQLVGFAYDSSGAVVTGPDFISKEFWDITGKIPVDPSAAQGPGSRPRFTDVSELRLMVRSLLADRFQLTGHFEPRPIEAYTLYPGTPKMAKAEPGGRTSCKEAPGKDGKDPRKDNPVISRMMTCQNITMTQFANELQYYALDYIKTPVLNLSKLDGTYDFTLYWSSSRAARGVVTTGPNGQEKPVAPAGPNAPAESNEPSGAISLPDAVAKQMGLKLVKETRPVPTFVIDHVLETPTEN